MRFAPRCACGFAVAAMLLSPRAGAFEKLDGWFIALDSCAAMHSKNKSTNPGGVMTEVRRAYNMLGINESSGDHYQVQVPGAPVTEERWVRADCGVHVVAAGTAPPHEPGAGSEQPGASPAATGTESDDNLLALNWQPAFCETSPGKTECKSLNAGTQQGSDMRLSIHGLWPQPNGNFYCDVSPAVARLDAAGRWSELPAVELDGETRAALETAMPGTASFLERHEWIKHGTCHRGAGAADEYFGDALRLTAELNGSAVGRFLAENRGGDVRTADIAARFDEAFGAGAGRRVAFTCERDGGRTLIVELRIGLRGVIGPETGIGALMLAAQPVGRGCAGGVLDLAGLQ